MQLPNHTTGADARRSGPGSHRPSVAAACLLLAFLPGGLSAQTRSIRFDRIQAMQGLPVDSVTSILQDRIGFMWIGTQDGLARFDGQNFVIHRHDPDDPKTLPNDHVEALIEDAAGDLWIGTQRGLSRWHLDRGVFTHYLHDPENPNSLGGDQVQALFQDGFGMLWIGTDGDGVDRLDPATGRFEHFRSDPEDPASLSDDHVTAVFEDGHGLLWVGTVRGLNHFERNTGGFVRYFRDEERPGSLSGNHVRSIYEDQARTLWVGTLRSGLARFDRATSTFDHFQHRESDPASLANNTVRALHEDRQKRLWIGTDGGLQHFLPSSETFITHRHDPGNVASLSSDRVTAIYQDAGGVLWIGTQGGGLNRVTPTAWGFSHRRLVTTDPEHPASNDILALAEDRAGELWIGTSGGGLVHADPATGATERFLALPDDPGSLSNNWVSALLEDRQGVLWAGTFAGLNRLDPGAREFRRYVAEASNEHSLGSDGIMTLFEDRRGRMWVGTFGGGLHRFEPETETFVRFAHDPEDSTSLSNDSVTCLAEDPEGALWIGTLGGGLNRYVEGAPGKGFMSFRRDLSRPTGLASDQVLSVFVDRDGTVWIGTDSGLHELDRLDESAGRTLFRRYLVRDGLPNDTIYGIHGSEGELWLSTNKGLSRFDPRNDAFENYTVGHGLQGNEFNMGAHFKSSSGELLFGGVNGFNVFVPGEIFRNSTPPPMALTSFSIPGKPAALDRPVYTLDEIRLDASDSVFSFEFAALDFSAPQENLYEYKLEGRDDDWIALGNHPRVTFSKIDPGAYTLRVKGSNIDGVWNDEGLAVKIFIKPPFWKTWWFQLISFLVAAAVVAYFLRTRMIRITAERLKILVDERTRELEETQKQLFRRKKLAVLGELAGSVAHELRNPLGAIKNSLYLLNMKTPDAETLKRYLGMIDQEIRRSDRIISELLDWGREMPAAPRRFAIQEIVHQALDETRIPEEVTVDRSFDAELLTVDVDPGQILRVLKNFLTNAIEAMPAGGQLRVECGRRGDEAVAAVVDTGVGIEEDDISKIFEPLVTRKSQGVGLGLPLSQRYAERNGGRIECESKIGEGSTFRLVLPMASPEEEFPEESLAAAS